jgi:LCP family protein required for cell wall assembly
MTRERTVRYYTPYGAVPMRRPQAARPVGRRRSGATRIALLGTVLLFLAFSTYTALAVISRVDQTFLPGNEISFASLTSGHGLPAIAEPEDDPIKRRINLLVMGVDKRPQEEIDTRADTIIVLTIDPKTKTAGVLGVPRDLYVRIPDGDGGFTEGKINSANAIAESRGYDNGAELVMATVEENLGLELDDYIVIDFVAFQDFIDAIGGIEVDVDSRIYYPNYSIDDIAGRVLEIEPGLQHMDGYTALAYSRYREDSDFARIKRQQQVIFATLDKAFDEGLATDPGSLKDLYDTWHDTVDTSLSSLRIPGLALLAREISEDRITRASLGDAVRDGNLDGEYVAYLKPAEAQDIIDLIFRDPRIINEGATIEVLNGSGVDGLASFEKGRFIDRGIPESRVVNVGNAPDDFDWENTLILVRTPGHDVTAHLISEWLSLNNNRIRYSGEEFSYFTNSAADIIVILGTEIADAREAELAEEDEDT